jgi:hypothetical protein
MIQEQFKPVAPVAPATPAKAVPQTPARSAYDKIFSELETKPETWSDNMEELARQANAFDKPIYQIQKGGKRVKTGKNDGAALFAHSIGEGQGYGDPTGRWKQLGWDNARDFWKDARQITREKPEPAVVKYLENDVDFPNPDYDAIGKYAAGLEERIYENTGRIPGNRVAKIEEGLKAEISGKTPEELTKEAHDLAKELAAESDAQIAAIKARMGITGKPELFPTSEAFSLSGQQPVKQTPFVPPEVKGGKLFETKAPKVEELRARKKPGVIND